MRSQNDRVLPSCFVAPQPPPARQRNMFGRNIAATMVWLRISADDMKRWRANGWLSFDADSVAELDAEFDPREWELTIVRDVVRSGLSDSQINHILRQLPHPCAVDPDRLAYSFRYGWVESTSVKGTHYLDVIERSLYRWLDRADSEQLRSLHDQIAYMLAADSGEEVEEDE
jgi:hypothetical protein